MQIKSFSAFTAFSIHPMLCRLQRIPGVDVRNIGLEAMTNDASGFPYHDNLQVLNDNHLMGKRKKRLMQRFIISIIGKLFGMAQSKRLLRTITERKCPLA
jgi:hypothetical protein